MMIVLTIAGSDTSAGAGIQQDLKTITALGAYGTTVITALTAQNTMGVRRVMPIPADVVKDQIDAVMDDLEVAAVKIGMIPNLEVAQAIVAALTHWRTIYSERGLAPFPIVWDPVMISTSGTRLMGEDCISFLLSEFLPLCSLITPNLPESVYFVDRKEDDPSKTITIDNNICSNPSNTHSACTTPSNIISKENQACINLLIKGGHAEGEAMTDHLLMADGSTHSFTASRIDSHNLHGTGCTLSSAIAVFLANGHTLPAAVSQAKDYLTAAILAGCNQHIGHGNGPLGIGL